jgi:2-polyprenyl-3-methyl-5-hydroxy-6-metoxy-1,4-benzoquinol methylase
MPTDVDQAVAEEFAGRMLGVVNAASTAFGLGIGDKLGLFDTLAGLDPSTSQQLADASGMQERYIREWLNGMVVSGVVSCNPDDQTYWLPAEHGSVTKAAGPGNVAAFTRFFPMFGEITNELCEAFVNGGGVPYSSYREFTALMAESSATIFDFNLVDAQIPLVDGIVERLAAGIRVADMGCGSGHAINLMAQAWPNSDFTGFDISEAGIAAAKAEAEAFGLSNAHFELQDISKLPESFQFDFITTFDAVHDQADPAGMLRVVAAALAPRGTYLCADIAASSHVHENMDHPIGPFGYTISLFHCMTVSLAEGGEGLGAMWGEQKAREMFAEAGFLNVDVKTVPGDMMNNFYIARAS